MNISSRRNGATGRREQGVVLVVALVVLVAMAMAGIAMMRQITGALGVAGNLAFKQTATSAGDAGLEAARAWLVSKTNTQTSEQLIADIAPGYYASWAAGDNPVEALWNDANSVLVTPTDGDNTGNVVRYKIHRLCSTAGLPVTDPNNKCVILTTTGTGATKQTFRDGDAPFSQVSQPYYRVTAQVIGPRNTVSYVQMIMY